MAGKGINLPGGRGRLEGANADSLYGEQLRSRARENQVEYTKFVTPIQTADYKANYGEFVRCDPTSAGFNVTLPQAENAKGRKVAIKMTETSTNTVTVYPRGTEKIEGESSVGLTGNHVFWEFVSDGSNWLYASIDPTEYIRADGTIELTADWGLGNTYGLTEVPYIALNTSFSDGTVEGRLQWNSTDGTLEYGLPGGNVNLQVGQEQLVKVSNKSGGDITNGQAVYISGAQGSRPTIELAIATDFDTSDTVAVATEDIANNSDGYVTVQGLVRDIDTSAITAGSHAYISASVAGALTGTMPDYPNNISVVGTVLFSDASSGILYVHPHIHYVVRSEWNQNGFENRTDSTLTWTDSSPDRTLSIQPTGTDFNYWIGGIKYTSTGDTVQITDVAGMHYIYYDTVTLTAIANPTAAQISSILRTNALVASVYWNATNSEAIYVGEERHGKEMAPDTHNYLHFSNGLQYRNGLGLNTISADGAGATADAQFGVDAGAVADEDIYSTISAVASTTGLPIYYMVGASSEWYKHTEAGFSVRTFDGTSSTRLAWNEFTGGAWQLTQVDSNSFVLCHVLATTEKDNPLIAIMGQAAYLTIVAAREGALTEIQEIILTDLPLPEIRPIATLIFQTNLSYANDVNALVRTTDLGDDYIDWRNEVISRVSLSTTDHGSLTGLSADDHTQYSLVDGTRAFTDSVSITTTADATDTLLMSNASTGTSASAQIVARGSANQLSMNAYGQNYNAATLAGYALADAVTINDWASQPSSRFLIGTANNIPIHLFTNNARVMTLTGAQVGVLTDSPHASSTVDIRGALYVGPDSGAGIIEIGHAATGNRQARVDLRGDDTYTDYGLRLVRNNAGANTTSQILHRGTGALELHTNEAAAINFYTTNTNRASIASGGDFTMAHSLIMSNTDPYIRQNVDTKYLILSGGSGWTTTGATMVLRGASAAFNAGGVEFNGVTGSDKDFILTELNLGVGKTPDARLSLNFSTEDLSFVDAGSTGATEQDWIEVQCNGVTGYIRVFASK